MIRGKHSVLRTTDPDDAAALHRLYWMGVPRSALLDQRREPIMPTLDELRETLHSKEAAKGAFYTIEDTTGDIVGFCILRGMNREAAFGEFSLLLYDEAHYDSPLAHEIFDFARDRAFDRLSLRKILAHALDNETGLHQALLRHGFQCNGVQRQVYWGAGRWHDVATFTLVSPNLADLPPTPEAQPHAH